jgi:hypothetical protein
MGQFYHEAATVDPRTGIVYMTEDTTPKSGFYRYIPDVPGRLGAGGRLQMMQVEGRPDLRDDIVLGQRRAVRWVDIRHPELGVSADHRAGDGVVRQGLEAGASAFVGLEGCTFSAGRVYFNSKFGGNANAGYIFEYDPDIETVWLIYESPGHHHISGPDNMVVSPRGSLVVCEDRVSGNKEGQILAGLTSEGRLFRFGQINTDLEGSYAGFDLADTARLSEWAGVTFSEDGQWLFVNLYQPGVTVAITGPWQDGMI